MVMDEAAVHKGLKPAAPLPAAVFVSHQVAIATRYVSLLFYSFL